MTFFIKKNSTLPMLKFPLSERLMEKYDVTEDMLENCAVTFSMYDVENEVYKIANKEGRLLINETSLDDEKYSLVYKFSLSETSRAGNFEGEFKIDFLGDYCGKMTFPADDKIKILIQNSITKTNLASELNLSQPDSPSIVPYFYGTFSSGAVPVGDNRPSATEALVKSGTQVNETSNGTITINFNSDYDDYLFFAIPSTSTAKTVWVVDEFNNGEIGGAVSVGGNLFPDPVAVNVNLTNPLLGIVEYQVYITNYQTQVQNNIEFRNT